MSKLEQEFEMLTVFLYHFLERQRQYPCTTNRTQTIINKWWEYQNALNPVSFFRVFGRCSLLRRNQGWANVYAIAISTTITTPVQPSVPFTNHQQSSGLFSPKNCFIGSYSSSDACSSLGKSHVKCAPACSPTPIAIPKAIT